MLRADSERDPEPETLNRGPTRNTAVLRLCLLPSLLSRCVTLATVSLLYLPTPFLARVFPNPRHLPSAAAGGRTTTTRLRGCPLPTGGRRHGGTGRSRLFHTRMTRSTARYVTSSRHVSPRYPSRAAQNT